MSLYKRHVFVCVNERPEGSPRGCCALEGARELRARLKQSVKEAGLKDEVRINAAGCLDQCEVGPVIAVYPEGIWYQGVSAADCDEIFREHIQHGRPVERLRLHQRVPKAKATEARASQAGGSTEAEAAPETPAE